MRQEKEEAEKLVKGKKEEKEEPKLESKFKELEEKQGKPLPKARGQFAFQFQPVIVPIIQQAAKVPSQWKKARGETLNVVKKLEKIIPDYSYQDTEASLVTDDKICSLLVDKLGKSKIHLFDLTSYLYTIHREDKINRILVGLRDSIDIFSDEIKARYCKWRNVPSEWLRKIIRYDRDLIKGVNKLYDDIETMKSSIFHMKRMRIHKKNVEIMPEEWNKYKRQVKRIDDDLDELVRLFKEREAICNLRAISLDKTFQSIRDKLKDSI